MLGSETHSSSTNRDAGRNSRSRWPIRATAVLVVAGAVHAGVSGYTFQYAEGFSYFSTDPQACANCHIMQPQYDSWQKASHHAVATCVDCHLPHTFFHKYLAKAENGYHHSKGFTFQDFHEPIQIKEKNSRILQQNCIDCHGEFVHAQITKLQIGAGELRCVHCHDDVGHGPPTGLGGPMTKTESGTN
jgi:cytochrome c nitrite reductase small subunit